MRKGPSNAAVDSGGFDDYIGTGAKKKAAKKIGISAGRWPTAKEVADSIKKQGIGGSASGSVSAGAADVGRTATQFLDPAYFDPLLFFIQHRDRKELNFRLRHAYEYEPIVGNLIDLHRTMPLSDYRLSCRDKSIERDFSDFAERMELLPLSSYILGDYFLLGEAIIWKEWDDYNKEWKNITLIPPEKVEMRRVYLTKPLMMLHVDSDLKRLVNSADEVDKAIVKMMDPDFVEKIRTSSRIYLPPHQADHFSNKTSHSDLRGTSILKRALYALLLKYKVRLLHSTYMDRGTFPLKIFKLGHPESKWVPSRAHFEALRNMLAAAANDPDFNIIYHYGLNVEYHGVHDKWEDLIKHYDWADREIMTALFASEALLRPKGTTFANANISVRVLMSRYQTIRTYLELLWKNKIFRPMAEAREYWVSDSTGSMHGRAPMKQRNGKFYYLDVPRFKWAKLNLLDDTAQKQFLVRMREKMEIPHKVIAEIFDLDPEEIKQQLGAEEGSNVDPIVIEARKKAASDPSVASQVLQGKKAKEWILPQKEPEDQAREKKQKQKVDTPSPTQTTPLETPKGPPAVGGGATPSLADNAPGTEAPGGRENPTGAPTGQGTPPENPPTKPGSGVTSPPI